MPSASLNLLFESIDYRVAVRRYSQRITREDYALCFFRVVGLCVLASGRNMGAEARIFILV